MAMAKLKQHSKKLCTNTSWLYCKQAGSWHAAAERVRCVEYDMQSLVFGAQNPK